MHTKGAYFEEEPFGPKLADSCLTQSQRRGPERNKHSQTQVINKKKYIKIWFVYSCGKIGGASLKDETQKEEPMDAV